MLSHDLDLVDVEDLMHSSESRTRSSTTTSWTGQSTSARRWASVMQWPGGSRQFLEFQPHFFFSPDTPAKSASRDWTGWRCTWRTRSWLQSSPSTSSKTIALVREAPWNDKCCSNGFCPNSFSTPPPSSKRTLWGYFFRRKLVYFLKQRFWLWELIFWKWQWSNIILRWYSDGNQVR